MNRNLLIITLFTTFIFLSLSLRTGTRHKSRMSHRIRHKHRKDKEPKTIQITPAEDAKNQEANAKANELFTTNSQGRDQPDPVFYTENLLFKYLPPQLELQSGMGDRKSTSRDIIITRCTIAVVSQMNYRGIEFGINLLELAGKDLSSVSVGNCCEGLGDTYIQNIEVGNGIQKQHCFRVTGTYDAWLLCHPFAQNIYDFRMKLMVATIKAVLRHQGIYNVNVLLPNDNLAEWTWKSQANWPGLCEDGGNQSPIDIDTGLAEEVGYMTVSFRFKEADDAVVKWNGHENEVFGDFGKFIHKLEIGKRNFMIYKLKFKFRSEHNLMGLQHDGELQVFGMSSDGGYSVFSFFIDEDMESAATWNQFIDSLKIQKWTLNNDNDVPIAQKLKPIGKDSLTGKVDPGAKAIQEKNPNLDLLIVNTNDKGIEYKFKDIYRRSFVWYTGSMTTPPCKEGVGWFIFELPIYIPSIQFKELREKVFMESLETIGNSRKAKHMGSKKLYRHIDNGKKCAETPLVPFDSDGPVDQDKIKIHTLDLTGIKPTFLKASNIITSYGYTGMNLPPMEQLGDELNSGKQTISLFNVKPEEVPHDIKQKLLKKSNEIIQKLNKNDPEIMNTLEAEEAIKVPFFD